MRYNVPANVKKKGKFCTEADVLKNTSFKGKDIDFKMTKDKLVIKSGNGSGQLDTLDAEDFDKDFPHDIPLKHKFNLKAFKDAVDSMNYESDVIETIDVKPVNIKADGKSLKCWSVDRYCLGVSSFDHKSKKFELKNLPIDLLVGLMPYLKSDFQFGLNDQAIRIKTDLFDLMHVFEQPEEQFEVNPDEAIKSLKEEKTKSKVVINSKEVSSVMEQVASFSGDQLKKAKATLNLDKKTKKLNLKVERGNGHWTTTCDLKSITKSITAKISLYILVEFLDKVEQDVALTVYENKLVIADKNRTFIASLIG